MVGFYFVMYGHYRQTKDPANLVSPLYLKWNDIFNIWNREEHDSNKGELLTKLTLKKKITALFFSSFHS